MLENLARKIRGVEALIGKNKTEGRKKDLNFPFLLVSPEASTNSTFEVSLEEDRKRISFISNKKMFLMGDCDVCSFLEIPGRRVFEC